MRKFSVITVVFNDLSGLERTFENVLEQTHPEVEYIIIDGGSKDGCESFVKGREKHINVFISEPDRGIYDAMNKGARHATGDYLIFMNAGDEFFAPDVLSTVDALLEGNPEVAYGNRCYVGLDRSERIDIARPMATAHIRMPFCHQAAFYRRDVFDEQPYNITFRSAGDYNQAVQLHKAGKTFQKLDLTICRFFAGGLSESGLRAYLDVLMIQLDNFPKDCFRESHYLKSFAASFNNLTAPFGITPKPSPPLVPARTDAEAEGERLPVAETLELLREVDLDSALFIDRYILSKRDETEQRKLRDMWRKTTMSGIYPVQDLGHEALFVKSLHRPDYNQLFDMIAGCCPVPYDRFDQSDQPGSGMNPLMVQAYMDFLPLGLRITAATPLEREALYLQLLKYIMRLRVVLTSPAKLAVLFSDMQPFDNLVSQAMALRGTRTATLQHALYVDYKDMDTINTVNYLCQPSQWYLAWGQNTVDLIRRYHPQTRFEICGKPNLLPLENPPAEKDAILVIFDQRIFDAQNRKVATIARNLAHETGHELRFRLHPQTNEAKFRAWFPMASIVHDINPTDIIVGHSSSLLLELFEAGHQVFQLRSDSYKIDLPDSLRFGTAAELRKRIFNDGNADDLRGSFIAAIGKDSRERYQAAFTRMLE